MHTMARIVICTVGFPRLSVVRGPSIRRIPSIHLQAQASAEVAVPIDVLAASLTSRLPSVFPLHDTTTSSFDVHSLHIPVVSLRRG